MTVEYSKILLSSDQETYKKKLLDFFIETSKTLNLSEKLIEQFIPMLEYFFLEGVMCERTIKETCLN